MNERLKNAHVYALMAVQSFMHNDCKKSRFRIIRCGLEYAASDPLKIKAAEISQALDLTLMDLLKLHVKNGNTVAWSMLPPNKTPVKRYDRTIGEPSFGCMNCGLIRPLVDGVCYLCIDTKSLGQ